MKNENTIFTTKFFTPLSEMFAAYFKGELIMFTPFEKECCEKRIENLKKILKADKVIEDKNIFKLLEKEINEYFFEKRTNFTIPLKLIGTPFQIKVWEALLKIPYGKTISYKEEAKMIENEKAFRAVANANGKNNLNIIVPCHRVISNNGEIGGYTGGIEKKEFLLKLEQNDK
ncbi:methylated-DNA--[protein]-cysteine S-methyltransferase [Aliarcobacter butzleri]|uniref:methylated-DNA--[protein]-cysteine S-methyltransferase n=1 Tax=Aliarcobacter butzleri TaxID=28197 RepID=A0AAW7QET3_9BACT|nr:methylated-DNA--[protein]-cysteine S-methyltransferase [Aliarcobacter butzleri]MDN5108313.1 methylated-DNA--[protein]-cysteine S-methyltransferase [Aliarcobacter butzleri]MDN5124346.1 methylated-DNA--[protein]-cysteine S-methyltransferase [Aliarcobacter butzleri]